MVLPLLAIRLEENKIGSVLHYNTKALEEKLGY